MSARLFFEKLAGGALLPLQISLLCVECRCQENVNSKEGASIVQYGDTFGNPPANRNQAQIISLNLNQYSTDFF